MRTKNEILYRIGTLNNMIFHEENDNLKNLYFKELKVLSWVLDGGII